MKILLYLFVIVLFILLGLAIFGGIWIKNNTSLEFNDFFNRDGEVEIDKDKVKDGAKELDGKIYKEATEHNPEGDMLPDGIDDKIREKLKEEIKEELKEEIKNEM
ncbi:MAG: hypothetical protein HQ538_00175 [Parcubacteria group bacterium]|nr:hypothetical protein [Parcubacteria group bacterium]